MDVSRILGWLGLSRLGRAATPRAIAEGAGLTVVGTTPGHGVRARRGELTVFLGRRSWAGGTRVEIRPVARGLSACRVVGPDARFSGVETGDAAFDAEVRFSGTWLLVRALLDSGTRDAARDAFAVAASVSVADGALVADFDASGSADRPFTAPALERLLALAERLREPADPVPRLAEIARTDRDPVVRRSAVAVLGRDAEDRRETRQARKTACLDPDPSVRLAGARYLGAEGVAVAEEVARNVETPDAFAADAIEVLGDRLSSETRRAILDVAGADRPRTACAALASLNGAGREDVERIAAVLGRASTGPVAQAAVEALVRAKVPAAAEPALAAALGSDVEVARAAARALARIGTADSVPALRGAEERTELARTAREAIVAIQSRLTGASPGQLALAGASGGELAVAEADGRVSLGPRDPEAGS
ncbi:MAG: hypothetical protein ABW221_25935 [Vicinamibacteria bacterium]